MYRIAFSDLARKDLAGIADYLVRQSPHAAEYVCERILEGIETLSEFPLRCAVAPESGVLGEDVRFQMVFDCRVLYVVRGGRVFIARIVHGAMNPPVRIDKS